MPQGKIRTSCKMFALRQITARRRREDISPLMIPHDQKHPLSKPVLNPFNFTKPYQRRISQP
ncbi:hypothetical protein CCP2SC5_640008 [Azospirillaceae bacterium]